MKSARNEDEKNMATEELTMSVGRDYRTSSRYEFGIFRGDNVVTRQGFFTSAAKARREGLKVAASIMEEK